MFGYTIETGDIAAVGEMVGEWASVSALQPRESLGRRELSHDGDTVEILGEMSRAGTTPLVVLTGWIAGEVASVHPKLKELYDAFASKGLAVSGEYEGFDANEESITGELKLP
ncbi:MAG: hypothetical protein HKN10_02580 [Myxococcales bacterium]|nr:hypothetical protein [Myxococcales bacterium]